MRVRTSLLRRYHPPENLPGPVPGSTWSAPAPARPRKSGRDLALLVLAAAVVVFINILFGFGGGGGEFPGAERDEERVDRTE